MRYLWEAFTAGPPLGTGRLPLNLFLLPAIVAAGFVHPAFWVAGAALEFGFMGALMAMPRFRRAVDAKWRARTAADEYAPEEIDPARERRKLLAKLHPDRRIRFGGLQKQAAAVRRVLAEDAIDDFAQEGSLLALDKLEWTYLKLLLARENLGPGPSMAEVEAALAALPADADGLARSAAALRVESARRREAVEADLARIDAQVAVALENARLRRHDADALPDIALVTRLGDTSLFGDAAESVRRVDASLEPSATTTAPRLAEGTPS